VSDKSGNHGGDLGVWWWQGLRSVLLLRVDWGGLSVSPEILAWLAMAPFLVAIAIARLYIVGEAVFFPPALLYGWLGTVVAIWISWLLVPDRRLEGEPGPPSMAHLFAMLSSQSMFLLLVTGLSSLLVVRGLHLASEQEHQPVYLLTAWGLIAWMAATQLFLVWRIKTAAIGSRWTASIFVVALLATTVFVESPSYWSAAAVQGPEAAAREPFRLTQELIERQLSVLQEKLGAVGAGRAGAVNLYAITFAPYADEDVFRRESELVTHVMQQRFGADGKSIQLVNSAATAHEMPWATPLNLRRAIQRVADVMDRERDVLFIHLTSHGARSGQLAAAFWPLTVDVVTPALLKAWMDEAGIRYRIISVSACYSGSWLEPLSDPGTLVMTAADADHTSYGCGRGSEFTYFGRAMYAEELQRTWSFEQAHASARLLIERRERDAGKTDGYSNPQILMGDAIRPRLAQLAMERQARQ
jgi:hypothetical protein